MQLRPIAYYRGQIGTKFGVPRQSSLANALTGTIVFEPEFRREEALRGLLGEDGFDWIWLIWGFSLNNQAEGQWQPTVRPPRLGGNASMGVFATRSPFRPNPIGLSAVHIEKIENSEITVSGADLADGTPIYDIKPYLVYADCHPEASRGFASSSPEPVLEVLFNVELPFGKEDREALRQILSLDPRPAYQDKSDKKYGLIFEGYDIKFRVDNDKLIVTDYDRH